MTAIKWSLWEEECKHIILKFLHHMQSGISLICRLWEVKDVLCKSYKTIKIRKQKAIAGKNQKRRQNEIMKKCTINPKWRQKRRKWEQ